MSRENVTGLLRWFFQIKIENICLFRVIKKHGNVFKNWLCPNFLLLPQKSALSKLCGGCSPPRPPPSGPYAYKNLYLPTISESSCRDWNFRIYPTVFWILPNVAENTRRCSDDFLKTSKRFPMIYCKHWLSGHSILDPRALMFLTLRVRS